MKKIIGVVCVSVLSVVSYAQTEFSHSIGVSYIMGINKYTSSPQEIISKGIDESGKYILGYPGLTYNPRLDFVLKENMSVSLTTYPTVAFGGANSREGANSSVAFEVPVVGQLNIGHHASERSKGRLGYYFGGGYNVGMYPGVGMGHGPTVQGGVRFALSKLSFTFRAFGTFPINLQANEKLTLIGGGILLNLDYKTYTIYKK